VAVDPCIEFAVLPDVVRPPAGSVFWWPPGAVPLLRGHGLPVRVGARSG